MTPQRRQAIHQAMVQLSDGDRSAFPVLLDELWPVLLAFAVRGAGAVDGEDVAQEAFYRLCAHISSFDRARDGLSWAFSICAREILTHHRRAARRREVAAEASADPVDASASPEERLLREELLQALASAVGELSEDDRHAIVGAVDTSTPPATQRKRRQRALERLRAVWRTLHGEP